MTGCLPIDRFIRAFFSLLGRHHLGPGSVRRVGYIPHILRLTNRPKRNNQNQRNKPALKVKNRCRWYLIRGGRGFLPRTAPKTKMTRILSVGRPAELYQKAPTVERSRADPGTASGRSRGELHSNALPLPTHLSGPKRYI